MKGELDLPPGYVASRRDRAKLVADVELEHELKRAGLDRAAGWETHLGEPSAAPGRGATSLLELPSGRVLRLKRLRRGGWLAPLWRDHFRGEGRAVDWVRSQDWSGRAWFFPLPQQVFSGGMQPRPHFFMPFTHPGSELPWGSAVAVLVDFGLQRLVPRQCWSGAQPPPPQHW